MSDAVKYMDGTSLRCSCVRSSVRMRHDKLSGCSCLLVIDKVEDYTLIYDIIMSCKQGGVSDAVEDVDGVSLRCSCLLVIDKV